MLRRRLTRRQTLQAGAAALAAGFMRPLPAVAAPGALFELALDDELQTATAAAAGWRTTRPLRAPRRFDLMGLHWRSARGLEAQVRTRRNGGAWSAWTTLHTGGAHAPDGEPASGSEPVFTGAADSFQLRLRGSARGISARFVRAQPTARIAGRLARRTPRARSAARSAQAGSAPPIIPRAAWGADAVPPRTAPSYGSVQLAFVHHTATSNDYSPEESAGIVLGICRYHRNSNGWNDIGYNFLVDKYGQVFEGRAGGVEQPVIGAQAQGYNAVSTGIACIGDFSTIAASPAALDAIGRLLGWKLSLHGVPAQGQVTVTSAGGPSNRYPAGTPVTLQRISGHRDGDNTSCPGEQLYALLPALRARAAAHAAPASALSARVGARTLRGPAATRLSGSLRFADGSSPAGLQLAIEFRAAGTAIWRPVGSAQTAADGSWSTEALVPRTGAMRAVWPGDATRAALHSPPIAVTVLPLIFVRALPRRLRAGRVIRVRGNVAPVPEPARVTVTLERRRGSRYVRVRRRTLRAGGGDYLVRLRLPLRGLYRVTVAVPGGAQRRYVRATT